MLKGDDQALNFFRVNPSTGDVSLSQPLFVDDSFNSVTVSYSTTVEQIKKDMSQTNIRNNKPIANL